MKNFFSRVAAIAATTAMLASYATIPAFAAGLTAPTAAIDAADVTAIRTVTLTLPAASNFTDAAGFARVVVRTMAGAAFDLSGAKQITAATNNGDAMTLTNAGDATGTIVVTDIVGGVVAATPIVLTFPANTFTANTAYQFSVYTDLNGDGNYSDGDFGSAVMRIGTSNDVVVSAQVEPTLTLVLTNATPNLGILSPTAISASATDPRATVATNANSGFTLQVADLDGNVGLRSATAAYTIAATANSATVAGTEGFDIEVTEITDVQTNGSVAAAFAAAGGGTITGAGQTIASSTGANQGYAADINVRAAISAITPAASDYTTSLTFTTTANF